MDTQACAVALAEVFYSTAEQWFTQCLGDMDWGDLGRNSGGNMGGDKGGHMGGDMGGGMDGNDNSWWNDGIFKVCYFVLHVTLFNT